MAQYGDSDLDSYGIGRQGRDPYDFDPVNRYQPDYSIGGSGVSQPEPIGGYEYVNVSPPTVAPVPDDSYWGRIGRGVSGLGTALEATAKAGPAAIPQAFGAETTPFGQTGLAESIAEDAAADQERVVPDYEKAWQERIAKQSEEFSQAEGFVPSVAEGLDVVGATLSSPTALGGAFFESLPYSLPSIAGSVGGAVAGAKIGGGIGTAGGPLGAGIGAAAGALIGGFVTEFGAKYVEEAREETAKRNLDPSNPENVVSVIADEKFNAEAMPASAKKAGAIASVDAALMLAGAHIGSRAARSLNKSVTDAATRTGFNTALLGAKPILYKRAQKQAFLNEIKPAVDDYRTAMGLPRRSELTGMFLGESAGEGLGEALGQLWADGEIDAGDVVLETMLGTVTSGVQTAIGANIGRREPAIVSGYDEALKASTSDMQTLAERFQRRKEFVADSAARGQKRQDDYLREVEENQAGRAIGRIVGAPDAGIGDLGYGDGVVQPGEFERLRPPQTADEQWRELEVHRVAEEDQRFHEETLRQEAVRQEIEEGQGEALREVREETLRKGRLAIKRIKASIATKKNRELADKLIEKAGLPSLQRVIAETKEPQLENALQRALREAGEPVEEEVPPTPTPTPETPGAPPARQPGKKAGQYAKESPVGDVVKNKWKALRASLQKRSEILAAAEVDATIGSAWMPWRRLPAEAKDKLVKYFEENPDAETIRSDTGQVPEEGRQVQDVQDASRENLQFDAQGWRVGIIVGRSQRATETSETEIDSARRASELVRDFDSGRTATEKSINLGIGSLDLVKGGDRTFALITVDDAVDLESALNRANAASNLFGNNRVWQSIVDKGFDSLKTDVKRFVQPRVIAALHDNDVLRVVVESVPVDVMHDFVGKKVSPDKILRNPDVLPDSGSPVVKESVIRSIGIIADKLAALVPRNDALASALNRAEFGSPVGELEVGTADGALLDYHDGIITRAQRTPQAVSSSTPKAQQGAAPARTPAPAVPEGAQGPDEAAQAFDEEIDRRRAEEAEKAVRVELFANREKESSRFYQVFPEDLEADRKALRGKIDLWATGEGDAPVRVHGLATGKPVTGANMEKQIVDKPGASYKRRMAKLSRQTGNSVAFVSALDDAGIPQYGFFLELPSASSAARPATIDGVASDYMMRENGLVVISHATQNEAETLEAERIAASEREKSVRARIADEAQITPDTATETVQPGTEGAPEEEAGVAEDPETRWWTEKDIADNPQLQDEEFFAFILNLADKAWWDEEGGGPIVKNIESSDTMSWIGHEPWWKGEHKAKTVTPNVVASMADKLKAGDALNKIDERRALAFLVNVANGKIPGSEGYRRFALEPRTEEDIARERALNEEAAAAAKEREKKELADEEAEQPLVLIQPANPAAASETMPLDLEPSHPSARNIISKKLGPQDEIELARTAPAPSSTIEEVRSQLHAAHGRRRIKVLERANRISILQSQDELLDKLPPEKQPSGGDVVAGAYHNGTMYLVADNIDNTYEGLAEAIFDHELVHSTEVREGPDLTDPVKEVLGRRFQPLYDQLRDLYEAGDESVVAAFDTVPDTTSEHLIESERLAYFVQGAVERLAADHPETLSAQARKVLRQIVEAFKAWFATTEIGKRYQFDLTDEFVGALVKRAVRREEVAEVYGGISFEASSAGAEQNEIIPLSQRMDAGRPEAQYGFAGPRAKPAQPRLKRGFDKLVQDAQEAENWRDWYEWHLEDLDEVFQGDAKLFRDILAITSQSASVKGGFTMGLKAYRQFVLGLPFEGVYLSKRALNKLRNEGSISGVKIGEYAKALAGDVNAIAVDRHVAMIMFGVKKPSDAQTLKAHAVIKKIAKKLGWTNRQVQASLWAMNQFREGQTIDDYRTEIRRRKESIQQLRAELAASVQGRFEGEGRLTGYVGATVTGVEGTGTADPAQEVEAQYSTGPVMGGLGRAINKAQRPLKRWYNQDEPDGAPRYPELTKQIRGNVGDTQFDTIKAKARVWVKGAFASGGNMPKRAFKAYTDNLAMKSTVQAELVPLFADLDRALLEEAGVKGRFKTFADAPEEVRKRIEMGFGGDVESIKWLDKNGYKKTATIVAAFRMKSDNYGFRAGVQFKDAADIYTARANLVADPVKRGKLLSEAKRIEGSANTVLVNAGVDEEKVYGDESGAKPRGPLEQFRSDEGGRYSNTSYETFTSKSWYKRVPAKATDKGYDMFRRNLLAEADRLEKEAANYDKRIPKEQDTGNKDDMAKRSAWNKQKVLEIRGNLDGLARQGVSNLVHFGDLHGSAVEGAMFSGANDIQSLDLGILMRKTLAQKPWWAQEAELTDLKAKLKTETNENVREEHQRIIRDIEDNLTVRELMGEFKDPRINMQNTLEKQGELIFVYGFLNRLAREGRGVFLWDESDPDKPNEKLVPLGEGRKYGPISGMLVREEVRQSFEDILDRENLSGLFRGLVQASGMVKTGATVYNPTATWRNFLSGSLIAGANWNFSPKETAKAFDVLKSYMGNEIKYLDQMTRGGQLGILFDGASSGETKSTLKDVELERMVTGKGLRTVKKLSDWATQLYQFGDDFWKMSGFEVEKQLREKYTGARTREKWKSPVWKKRSEIDVKGTMTRDMEALLDEKTLEAEGRNYQSLDDDAVGRISIRPDVTWRHPGLKYVIVTEEGVNVSPEVGKNFDTIDDAKAAAPELLAKFEMEKRSADRIRNTYPTYSMIGRLIRKLRRWPFNGPFVSFPAEIVRTTMNQFLYLKEDWNDPVTKPLAYRRAAGMAFASAWAYGLQEALMAIWDMDNDEEEALRDLAPEWNQNSNLAILWRDEKGSPAYLDLSFMDPYNYLKRPINALFRDRPFFEETVPNALWESVAPFASADILTGSLREVLENEKSTGAPIRNEQDTIPNQTADIGLHLWHTNAPGLAKNAERLYKAVVGDRKATGQPYSKVEEIVANFGFRVTVVDPKIALKYRSYEFNDEVRETKRIFNSTMRSPNTLSEGDIQDAWARANTSRAKAYEKMRRLIIAAQRSGLSRRETIAALRKAGISRKDIIAMMRDEVPRWKLSQSAKRKAIEQTRTFTPDLTQEIRERWDTALRIAQ